MLYAIISNVTEIGFLCGTHRDGKISDDNNMTNGAKRGHKLFVL